jgi:hypothetical protein
MDSSKLGGIPSLFGYMLIYGLEETPFEAVILVTR